MIEAKTFKDFIKMAFFISDSDKEIHSVYVTEFDYSELMNYKLGKRIRKLLGEGDKKDE
jgi:hypothetical protein